MPVSLVLCLATSALLIVGSIFTAGAAAASQCAVRPCSAAAPAAAIAAAVSNDAPAHDWPFARCFDRACRLASAAFAKFSWPTDAAACALEQRPCKA
eukprot:17509-Heterococcus_DN1.PRE.1